MLDSTGLIDISKGIEPVSSRIRGLIEGGDELGVSPVNVAEFYAGLAPEDYPVWDRFFESLRFWPVSPQAARRAGSFRYEWRRKGVSISGADALVAAVAEERQATILTDDTSGFPMVEVRTESLRSR